MIMMTLMFVNFYDDVIMMIIMIMRMVTLMMLMTLMIMVIKETVTIHRAGCGIAVYHVYSLRYHNLSPVCLL